MSDKEKYIKMYSLALILVVVLLSVAYWFNREQFHKSFSKMQSNEQQKDAESRKENALSEAEKQKLDELVKENEQLKEQLKAQENIVDKNADQPKQENGQNKEKQEQAIVQNVENLMEAKKFFDNAQYVECASCLEKIDKNYLGDKTKDLYDQLAKSSFTEAAKQLYFDGCDAFKQGNYQNAIEKLDKSLNYEKAEYFSDDALYFMTYAYYKSGNLVEAKKNALKLLQDYPDTSYREEINRLISNIPD